MRFLIATLVPMLALVGCSRQSAELAVSSKPALGSFGVDVAQMNRDVKPGDDFNQHVNGAWMASFQIPADKARYGVFDELRDEAENDVKALVDRLVADKPAPGTTEQKVADLFSSYMDQAAIEARSIEPLKPHRDRINAARTKADIVKLMGNVHYTAPFTIYVQPDPADTTKYTVSVDQSGLGMPDRDYYLKPGARFDGYRSAYAKYVRTIFELLGDGRAAAAADQVLALEKKVAAVHWDVARRRNVKETYNPMDVAGLEKLAPDIDWRAVLDEAGLNAVKTLTVSETRAVRDGAKLLQSEPIDAWKKYLIFHLVSDYAAFLPKAFDDANFEFYGRTLNGVQVQRDRWKRAIATLNNLIGEGVGRLYVAKYFPPESKQQMDALVANLRTALERRLKDLAWMDEPTRTEALKKLATFEPRIGYPDRWRDYTALSIEPGKAFENAANARAFEWNRQVARLGGPVDRGEWRMNAQTVNASYNPLMNQITFPAGILQPPFFDPHADPAVNYGAIGAVIGHEIGHGFDDQGREYDEAGKIRNWWTPTTNDRFVAATNRLAAQYDKYCPVEDACVNGRLTLGENIGDLGGIQMAYTAYRLSLRGGEPPVIDGFTGDQRFFLAYGQVWRSLTRDDALRSLMLTNPHSPPMFRVNGVVRNVDAWYDAFGVRPGEALYLPADERVRIW
jgi:endothelin-converting enzyme/putative endopeptidase